MKKIFVAAVAAFVLSGCLWSTSGGSYPGLEAMGDAAFPDDNATWTTGAIFTNGDLEAVYATPSVNVGGDGPVMFIVHDGEPIAIGLYEEEGCGWSLLALYE